MITWQEGGGRHGDFDLSGLALCGQCFSVRSNVLRGIPDCGAAVSYTVFAGVYGNLHCGLCGIFHIGEYLGESGVYAAVSVCGRADL